MMNAIEETLAYYSDSGRHPDVDRYLHERSGVCVWSPEMVLMARPVDSGAPLRYVTDPAHGFPVDKCDAWHIHYAAGDLSGVSDVLMLSRMFRWVTFQRCFRGDGRLHKVDGQRCIFYFCGRRS
ncbi:hypothetical protein QET40_06850 [Akkermansia sp. N21169]|uniref:hypothetical protein n=1 Tax=Akkermansia sp. N21169 TaxID=3040765 RepID=UPI00244E8F6B|nr:hypothetical protein [Akkermansia sp. N21169]MDH3068833.1 hypothetical protein [Akkermansia sp. N21169]